MTRPNLRRIEAATLIEFAPGRYRSLSERRFASFPAALEWVKELDPGHCATILDVEYHDHLAGRDINGVWRTKDGSLLVVS